MPVAPLLLIYIVLPEVHYHEGCLSSQSGPEIRKPCHSKQQEDSGYVAAKN